MLPSPVSSDFDPVPTQFHAAPPSSVLLAHIQKLHNTTLTLSHSAWLRVRQQLLRFVQQSSPKSIGYRCTANLPALHLSALRRDCSAYGMREKAGIQFRKEGRTGLRAVFQPQHGLTQRLTKDQKLAQEPSRLLLATPDLEFILYLVYWRQARYKQPAHECGRVRQHFPVLAVHSKPCVQQVQDWLIANHQEPVDLFLQRFHRRASSLNGNTCSSQPGLRFSPAFQRGALLCAYPILTIKWPPAIDQRAPRRTRQGRAVARRDLKDWGKHEIGVIAAEAGAVVPEVVS